VAPAAAAPAKKTPAKKPATKTRAKVKVATTATPSPPATTTNTKATTSNNTTASTASAPTTASANGITSPPILMALFFNIAIAYLIFTSVKTTSGESVLPPFVEVVSQRIFADVGISYPRER
jgi:hypothetical protein